MIYTNFDFTAWFDHLGEATEGTKSSIGHFGHPHELAVVTSRGGQAVERGQQKGQATQGVMEHLHQNHFSTSISTHILIQNQNIPIHFLITLKDLTKYMIFFLGKDSNEEMLLVSSPSEQPLTRTGLCGSRGHSTDRAEGQSLQQPCCWLHVHL